ncbi:UPF0262 family protein [Sinorhizobium saheli]|uniref:Uncharacterized protein n=1 Tax=Sinorhizobium saheli TaxID=36856 RepID=A0A178YU74_SINSA|nr:UPF0262 family protein [Sinorhizobium saheli]MQW90707.1 UPF0262 family protein [Sinorhizobium saheli]OAP50403.1 hypothetical protein ATB98_11730 [Sinorhizobium saheli]
MTRADFRLCDIALDCSFKTRDQRVEREQALAVLDLLETSTFVPVGHHGGPYRLKISMAAGRLAFHIASDKGVHVVSHYLSLAPFRRLLKDYTRVCENYYEAICRFGPDRLQAIDMGRRGIHDEAAELLRERLSAKVDIDKDTARRLFTLIYALIARNAGYQILLS